jgi:peptidoglycan/xylan/chitin deacetylase (PgdA/CDA1 family)
VQVLALTFDDGPLGETTLDGMVGLLDVLRAEQVPATFFVNTYANTFDHPKVQVGQGWHALLPLLSGRAVAQHSTTQPTAASTLGIRPFAASTCTFAIRKSFWHVLQGVLKRMLSEGHDLGSHTAEHLSLTNLTAEQVEEQLQWAISNISMITNSSTVPVSEPALGGHTRAAVPHMRWVTTPT